MCCCSWTSSLKGNDRSPESNGTNILSFERAYNYGRWKPEARNRTRLSFYACHVYQQLWWWLDQKWMSLHDDTIFPLQVWEIFYTSRAANSVVSGPIWPKFELVPDFMHVLVTCKYKKDRMKNNREKVETSFPNYKSMGIFCCHGNQSFDPICLKTLCNLSPTRMMLHIKFDQYWPTGFRDIQVQKCEIFVT